MKRRTFLKAGVLPIVLNIVSRVPPVFAAPSDFQSVVEEFRDTGKVDGLSVAAVRNIRQIDIGFCLPWTKTNQTSGAWWDTISEFSSACPEWSLNWDQDWRASLSSSDIGALRQAGLRVRGHTLYYYQNIPEQVLALAQQKDITPGKLGDFIYENARSRVQRWGDKVSYWVINETIDNRRGHGMRMDPVTSILGKDLFRILVAAVKDVDPNKKVEMNDYVIERRGPAATDHFSAVADYLDKHKLRFDRIGFKCHVDWHNGTRDFHPDYIMRAVHDLKSLGVDFAITEIDIDDRPFDLSPEKRDLFVAEQYYNVLRTLSSIPGLVEISTWSALDSDNWIRRGDKDKGVNSQQINDRSRCGWFDDNFKRKLSYYAICKALI